MASEYQEYLPEVEPIVRYFKIAVGQCSQCRRRVQGRHRLQTSDALGAASAQLGPNVAALVAEVHTGMGMPLAKVSVHLKTQFGLDVTPGGLVHLLHRTTRAAAAGVCGAARAVPAQAGGNVRRGMGDDVLDGLIAAGAECQRAGAGRLELLGAAAVAAVWVWWPFPVPGADPVADPIALHSPRLHAAIRAWHYLAPAVAFVGLWSVAVAIGRVWLAGGDRGPVAGRLPPWPGAARDPAPAVVVGEVHQPVDERAVPRRGGSWFPSWAYTPGC